MRKFKKNNREEYTSHHPSLKGITFRKEGMDTNGNRISSTDNEAFGQYAGWRRHKNGRYYGQDLYLNSGNAGDYYNDFVIPEGKIKRIVTECIANLKEEQDQEYAQNLVHIWVNNDRPLYDKKMQIVKMLAKKPSLDVNVLASSSMLAQFYRDIVNTARKSGDTISGDRKQLLMYLAQELLDAVAEYKNYECVSRKGKKLVKEGYNESKTPRFVYMGEINSGEGEYELFEYAKEQGWLDENATEEDFDALECFENHCSEVFVNGENSAYFLDFGDIVFVYVTNYSDSNLVREMVEDFIRFERTADFMGHRDGSWHEADEEEVENGDGVIYEFPSGLCRYYAR